MKNFNRKIRLTNAVTLMEMLIVVSLISILSLTLYKAFANGVLVWKRHRELRVEEDIALFFDKFSQDIRNTYYYAQIKLDGTENRIAFPTIVTEPRKDRFDNTVLLDQLGKVEYYFDYNRDIIYKREAFYGQALEEKYGKPVEMVKPIDDMKIRYLYVTENDIISTDSIYDVIPSSVEISVKFSDEKGSRELKRIIDLPLGS